MIQAGAFLGVAVVVGPTQGARVLAEVEAEAIVAARAGGCLFFFFCEILTLLCGLSLMALIF